MRVIRAVVVAVVGAVALVGSAVPARAAANKEHQQLMAEIRMLQEQQQQLQQLLGNLTDALKAVSTKLDDQSAAMRKAMADQTVTINGVGENVRILREKVDDTNVRVASVSQEIESLRHAIASQPTTQVPAPSTTGTEPAPGGATSPAPAPGQPPAGVPNQNPVPIGVSPQKLFDSSFDDYTAGRYDIAILGFQSYIQAYPRTPKAAEAQFYIGQSLFSQSKWREAQDAFQKVISDYPQSPNVPAAYYKLGQTFERMNQVDLARKAYDAVVKAYPDANDTLLARQALERLNRKE